MGHVFLGRDPELDRPVAIKTVRDLKMDEAARATFLERFKNEARAAARLHHPNIVQVYDVGEMENGSPYLVFEYVAGSTLKQVVRGKGPMSPERVYDGLLYARRIRRKDSFFERKCTQY